MFSRERMPQLRQLAGLRGKMEARGGIEPPIKVLQTL